MDRTSVAVAVAGCGSRRGRCQAGVLVLVGLAALGGTAPGWGEGTNPAQGRHGVVASVHPLATDAGLQVLRRGGNAVDAAVAVGLTLAVVDGHNSGLGGGCLMLIRLENGRIVALDGRETAPKAATPDMFVRQGRAEPDLSQTGALACGVPGALAAYEYASRNHGRRGLEDTLRAAADVAEKGFLLDASYAARIRECAPELRRFPEAKAILFGKNGRPLRSGDRLRQPDLARTLRALAQEGTDWFYRGPFARTAEAWMRDHGGLLRAEDFQAYEVRLREPVRTTYRGYEVVGFPPPSSGGVLVAQILNVLERFDLRQMGPRSADFAHVASEAMKRAFADRAFWLGDSDFARVPTGLASKAYAEILAREIRMDRAAVVPGHGTPPGADREAFGQHTTHFSVADAAGNWVACTATINTSFGSKVVVPGTGVFLNNQMDDFALRPGVTNYFGLVGGEANAVRGGKRPLSSMSPTVVLREGRPVLAVGAAGGPTIVSQTVRAILNLVDFKMDPYRALAEPRLHHQWQPDVLRLERGFPAAVRRELERRGHRLRLERRLGAAQSVGAVPGGEFLQGAHDPRVAHGAAAGW